MRMSLMLPVAAALAAAAMGISSPASATQISEAIYLCNSNPNCAQIRRPSGVSFTVGQHAVYCPYKGECACVACWGTPEQTLASSGVVATPTPVFFSVNVSERRHKKKPKQTPTAEPKPEPKPTPTAEPKQTPATPTRNARDHRVTPKVGDDRSSPGVKTTRYGYEGAVKATGTGPSDKRKPKIIDHRGVDPATRSGPSEARKPKIIDHRSSSVQPKNGGSGGGGGNICGAPGNPPCRAQ